MDMGRSLVSRIWFQLPSLDDEVRHEFEITTGWSHRLGDYAPIRTTTGSKLFPLVEQSRTLDIRQIERAEHEHDPDIGHQSLNEAVPEEQHVHTDDDGHHREQINDGHNLGTHRTNLTIPTTSSRSRNVDDGSQTSAIVAPDNMDW